MRIPIGWIAGLLSITVALAEEVVFTNQGLDSEIVVTLQIQEHRVSGYYRSHGYEGENIVQRQFAGEVLDSSTAKQKNLLIRFQGEIPYDAPEGKIVWKLRGPKDNQSLFITILGRDFETTPPTIKKYDIELAALPPEFEGD
jgi:hypothetical protein